MSPLINLAVCASTLFQADRDLSHVRLPVHGTIHNNTLHGFFAKVPSHEDLQALSNWNPLKDKPKEYRIWGVVDVVPFNFRHHIRFASIWICTGPRKTGRIPFQELQLFDISNKKAADEFCKRYPDSHPWETHAIELRALASKYEKLDGRTGYVTGSPLAVLGYGCVPIAEDTVKCYILTKPKKQMELWDTQFRRDEKKQRWQTIKDEQNLESIDSLFAEEFYFFVRKDDYFFVTESGKCYHAPPRAEGKKARRMRELWNDATLPIMAVIEDSDNDKVWLFVKDKNKEPKFDFYFEMKAEVRLKLFDPAKLAKVDIDNPRARQLLEYIPLIRPDLAAKKKGS